MTDQPCDGFPDDCPNRSTVEPTLAHGGGIRCGCSDFIFPNGIISADALKDVTFTASNIQTNLLNFLVNGKAFLTIHPDGQLKFDDDYTPDAAAQAFWEAVQRLAPASMPAAALVRVLNECDRIERAVRDNPTSPDFDGAYLACIGHIRDAAGAVPPGADRRQAAYDAVFGYIRQQPRDFLPTTVVDRNAMIWHAVHAALNAVGIPKKEG